MKTCGACGKQCHGRLCRSCYTPPLTRDSRSWKSLYKATVGHLGEVTRKLRKAEKAIRAIESILESLKSSQ